MVSGRRSEASVARQKRCVECFRERDVHRVVGGEVVPQLPHARQEEPVRVSAQWKIAEVSQRGAAAPFIATGLSTLASCAGLVSSPVRSGAFRGGLLTQACYLVAQMRPAALELVAHRIVDRPAQQDFVDLVFKPFEIGNGGVRLGCFLRHDR
jgi:hypothetical protein